jgi:hypothetical protein
MNENAHKFTEKRAIKLSKKRFIQVVEYVVFCYNLLKKDNEQNKICYSKKKKPKSIAFENWLKIRFVEDYLQQYKGHLACYSQIEKIRFDYETVKTYIDPTGEIREDKIDVFISNLGLQEYWGTVTEENIYFALECKRLKNTSHNADYVTDIQKFVERQHIFRFPFEGMIGFVEKSSISIDAIINDINERIRSHSGIVTTQELTYFPIHENFHYCRFSKHCKSRPKRISIEVYHLFFDYSNLIVD